MTHHIYLAGAGEWDIEGTNGKQRLIQRTPEGERFTANVDERGNGSVSHSMFEPRNDAYADVMREINGHEDGSGEFLWIPSDGNRPNVLTFKHTFSSSNVEITRKELRAYFHRLIEWQRLLTDAQLATLLRHLQQ